MRWLWIFTAVTLATLGCRPNVLVVEGVLDRNGLGDPSLNLPVEVDFTMGFAEAVRTQCDVVLTSPECTPADHQVAVFLTPVGRAANGIGETCGADEEVWPILRDSDEVELHEDLDMYIAIARDTDGTGQVEFASDADTTALSRIAEATITHTIDRVKMSIEIDAETEDGGEVSVSFFGDKREDFAYGGFGSFCLPTN